MELEYIQDAYTNKSYKLISEDTDILVVKNGKKRVTFDSQLFLDEMFSKAIKYAKRQQPSGKDLTKNCKLYVGIDIVSYGASTAKMAFVSKNRTSLENKIDLVKHHIGNLKLLPDYTQADISFIEEFQLMVYAAFYCFGKRWYELSEYDVKKLKSDRFCLIEINQYPYIYFEEKRYYRIETVVAKFFECLLKCLSDDIMRNENKLKRVCVAIPSDFHTYQRYILKNCLDSIGLKNYIITIKSTALAMPFLAKVIH